MNDEIMDWAVDILDERNWKYGDFYGDILENNLPESIVFLPESIYNQGLEVIMKMSCTRQSPVHIVNAQNKFVSEKTWVEQVIVDPKILWLARIKEDENVITRWDSIISWVKQCLKEWLITWFTQLDSIDEMKDSLSKWRLIATWSNNWNWNSVKNIHVYTLRTDLKKVWHAFCIVWYNPLWWIAINSYWDKNWIFTIPFDLTDTLYTRYSIMDSKDETDIIFYKQRIMEQISIEEAKKAFEAGIWNGLNPTQPASREEVAAMISRALTKALKK